MSQSGYLEGPGKSRVSGSSSTSKSRSTITTFGTRRISVSVSLSAQMSNGWRSIRPQKAPTRLSKPRRLLLTDVVTPLMNGVQPAAEMQALRPEVKILHMSAYRTKEIDEYRMQLELRGLFLDKPFTAAHEGGSGTSQRRPFDAVAADPLTGASGQRRHTLYWVSRIHFFSSSRSLYCAAVLRSIEV